MNDIEQAFLTILQNPKKHLLTALGNKWRKKLIAQQSAEFFAQKEKAKKPPMITGRENGPTTRWTYSIRARKDKYILERRGNNRVEYKRGLKWVSPDIYAQRYDRPFLERTRFLLKQEQIKRTGA